MDIMHRPMRASAPTKFCAYFHINIQRRMKPQIPAATKTYAGTTTPQKKQTSAQKRETATRVIPTTLLDTALRADSKSSESDIPPVRGLLKNDFKPLSSILIILGTFIIKFSHKPDKNM